MNSAGWAGLAFAIVVLVLAIARPTWDTLPGRPTTVPAQCGQATILNGDDNVIVTHTVGSTPSEVLATGQDLEVSGPVITSRNASTFTITVASTVSDNRLVDWCAWE